MRQIKWIVAFTLLLLPLTALPCSTSSTEYKLTLAIGQIDNQSSPVVDYITPGYMMRVIFSAKWEGNTSMAYTRLEILIDNRVVLDEKHSFYDNLYQFKSTFTKHIVVPKDLPTGKHTLTIRMGVDQSSKLPDQKLVCNPVSAPFWIGKPDLTSKEVTSQNLDLKIVKDKNPATGSEWDIIASDGISCLKISITATPRSTLTYLVPTGRGYISQYAVYDNRATEGGSIDTKEGLVVLYYFPPNIITEGESGIIKNIGEDIFIKMYSTRIDFTLSNSGGPKREGVLTVNYCRAPIVLVHGFTGDKSTWEELDSFLSQRGFRSNRENYYLTDSQSGSMNVKAQATLLGSVINLEKNRYKKYNVMLNGVDVVCHSMGGLIARYYTKRDPSGKTDIRKLIMVGTPNHGVSSTTDRLIGSFVSSILSVHGGMAEDVKSDSDFMEELNRGEVDGLHINKMVQHGNIFVNGTDGVVDGQSARLSRVEETILSNMKHSPAVPDRVTGATQSITTSHAVFDKILTWLIYPIPPGIERLNIGHLSETLSFGQSGKLTESGHMINVISGSLSYNKHTRWIETDPSCRAQIVFPNGKTMLIKAGSKLNYNPNFSEIVISEGRMITNLKMENGVYNVVTPNMKVIVKGTCLEIVVDKSGRTELYLYDGAVDVETAVAKKAVNKGEQVSNQQNGSIISSAFDYENRFIQQWSTQFNNIQSLNSYINTAIKPDNSISREKGLFSNVKTGGSLVKK